MSFVFYDTETTGTNVAFDQILQLAAIKADSELVEVDRFEIRSRLLPYVVPSPGAMRVTGLTVGDLTNPEFPSHYAMARAICEKLRSWSPAIFLGFNSLSFDEHLLRQTLYQTLHGPYLTNRNGNCRADALRFMQATSIFAPGVLSVPVDENGRSIFKLDKLAPANGFNHESAHNALGDVEATLYLCRLVFERAPDLWSSLVQYTKRATVVDFVTSEPLFSVTDFYANHAYSWGVTFIGESPEITTDLLVFDLYHDPVEFNSLPDGDLLARLSQVPRPVRRVRSNAAPIIRPLEDAPSFVSTAGIPLDVLEGRVSYLQQNEELRTRLCTLFVQTRSVREPSPHVEEQLYGRYCSRADEDTMERFHAVPWEERLALLQAIEDDRFRKLGKRLIFVERPDLFSEAERAATNIAIARRLSNDKATMPWKTLSQALQEADDLIANARDAEAAHLKSHRMYLATRLEGAIKQLASVIGLA